MLRRILRFLIYGPQPADPTRKWPPRVEQQLTFPFDSGRLNGAALGDSFEAASFLGPAEERDSTTQISVGYYTLGLGFDVDDDGRIGTWDLVFVDEERQYQPFAGRITHRAAQVDIRRLNDRTFEQRFGECYWRDKDARETILFYEFPGREWQVEFDLAGTLKRILVLAQPLMADDAQRAAYHVTREWPPRSWNS